MWEQLEHVGGGLPLVPGRAQRCWVEPRFVADDPNTWSEYIAKHTVGCVGEFSIIQEAMIDQAKRAKVEMAVVIDVDGNN